jgi:hypothetical protein
MSMSALVWVFVAAAALLAVWAIARFPERRPKSLVTAFVLFLGAQIAPILGLVLLPTVLRLGNGPQLALTFVVLPAFFILCVTSGWLLLAVGDAAGRHSVRVE